MKQRTINRKVFMDKVMGCWLGKNAGGTLGEPVEDKFGKEEMFHLDWYPSLPEGGIPNDDLELQLIWLQLLLQKGPGITASDFTEAWMDCIAYNFDEYGLSKENMEKGLLPPVCGWHNNIFRDCMGSPIRSEIWACLAPGCPEVAARYAFQDAIVDHGGGESVYGEIFNAVLESAAFVNSDKFELLELALSAIPEECLTSRCVRRSIENYRNGMKYEDNRNDLKERFFHPVSQYSPLNLGFQTIGWMYGEDFGDSICKAVNCGWDTDCTGATLGAILGILGGASSLPVKWIEPLGDEIATNMTTGGIKNLTAPTKIQELTKLVCGEAEKIIRFWGSDVRFSEEEEMSVGFHFDKPDMSWMESYQANAIPFKLGDLEETLSYHKDAAILGDRASLVTVRLYNPHPIPKQVILQTNMPDGFCIEPEGERSIAMEAGGEASVTYKISAPGHVIQESNRGDIRIQSLGHPAIPAIPLVLLGGSKWLLSAYFPGKSLEDDCGIAETVLFREAPYGFRPAWRPGNDLELGELCVGKGVVFALHNIYCEEQKEVVLGVPNNGRMKLYLNGEMIHSTVRQVPLRANLGNGGALGDLSNYKVTSLNKGWNQILIKLEHMSDSAALEAHLTIGGMSRECYKNHGMPVHGINRAQFAWEK